MGIYNTYGEQYIQLKCGDCDCSHYEIGSIVDIPDGVYIGYEGIVVVQNNRLVATFPPNSMYTKWGDDVTVDLSQWSPTVAAMLQVKKELDETLGEIK